MPLDLAEPTEIRHVRDVGAAVHLFGWLAPLGNETVAFAYLDPERRLLGLRHDTSDHAALAEVPVRQVIADTIALDAAAVVMAHNHPGGDPAPSAADRAVTLRLARALDAVEARLLDHIVLARDRSASFRALGLL